MNLDPPAKFLSPGWDLRPRYPRIALAALALAQRSKHDHMECSGKRIERWWYTLKVLVALCTRRRGLRATGRWSNETSIEVAHFGSRTWSGAEHQCFAFSALVVSWRGWPRWDVIEEYGP